VGGVNRGRRKRLRNEREIKGKNKDYRTGRLGNRDVTSIEKERNAKIGGIAKVEKR